MPIADFLALLTAHAPDKADLKTEIEQVFEKAGALETVKANNLDLTKQRETWEAEKKANKIAFDKLADEKKSVESKLVEAQKGTPDQAVLNGLKEQITNLTTQMEEQKAAAAKAQADKAASELKSAVLGAAQKAIDPNQLFILMQAQKLVGLKDDGTPFFIKFNAEKQPVALEPSEAVETFLKANPHLEKSSGKGGTGNGNENRPSGQQTNTGLLENPEGYFK